MERYLGFNYNNNINSNKKVLKAKLEDKIIYAIDGICTRVYDDVSTTGFFLNEQEKTITCTMHFSTFNLENRISQNSI